MVECDVIVGVNDLTFWSIDFLKFLSYLNLIMLMDVQGVHFQTKVMVHLLLVQRILEKSG